MRRSRSRACANELPVGLAAVGGAGEIQHAGVLGVRFVGDDARVREALEDCQREQADVGAQVDHPQLPSARALGEHVGDGRRRVVVAVEEDLAQPCDVAGAVAHMSQQAAAAQAVSRRPGAPGQLPPDEARSGGHRRRPADRLAPAVALVGHETQQRARARCHEVGDGRAIGVLTLRGGFIQDRRLTPSQASATPRSCSPPTLPAREPARPFAALRRCVRCVRSSNASTSWRWPSPTRSASPTPRCGSSRGRVGRRGCRGWRCSRGAAPTTTTSAGRGCPIVCGRWRAAARCWRATTSCGVTQRCWHGRRTASRPPPGSWTSTTCPAPTCSRAGRPADPAAPMTARWAPPFAARNAGGRTSTTS